MTASAPDDRSASYEKSSLSLAGAVSLGTGVMIGAGIFAIVGQIAGLAQEWFLLAIIAGGIVSGMSAYSYIRLSDAYPSAGGIAMFLEKAYGRTYITGASALLMYLSMVFNQSLVARTFGTYVIQPFDISENSWVVSALAAGLVAGAFLINIQRTARIQRFSMVTAVLKVVGLAALAIGGLAATGMSPQSISVDPASTTLGGFLAGTALAVLAYKGFTTITNSGGEITDPHQNVGRAIIISLGICVVVYALVATAVGSSLTINEILAAQNYALAEAARPTYGTTGVWLTVGVAIIATVSGIVASMFAVSRMLAMLTKMHLVPHSHFGMAGTIQRHTLIYTAVIALVLTVFFDLSRIAALGAILYLVMDMIVQWGVLRHLRHEVHARASIVIAALLLDAVVLGALIWNKASSDIVVLVTAGIALVAVFAGEWLLLRGESSVER